VVATGVGRKADGEGWVATSAAFSALIMLNNFAIRLFVDRVASAGSCSPASMLWSLLISIRIKPTTFASMGRENRGWWVLLTSSSVSALRGIQDNFLHLPSALWRVSYCKSNLTALRSSLYSGSSQGKSK
jgi:hypothetical protein